MLAILSTGTLCAESLEEWVSSQLSIYNIPDPIEYYFVDEDYYYFYILGHKHAYEEVLQKVRKIDIKELEMAD